MATDLGQGDAEQPYLDVAPADNTTLVTLIVTAPDGTTADVVMTGGALAAIPDTSPVEYTQRWTGNTPVVYTQPGKWVLHYDVTGTGEGEEDLEVYVVASPVAGGPTWTPGRSRPAAYVPHRTLVRNPATVTGSADEYAWTWDSTTTPPGTVIDRLIADGVAWVTARVSPMNALSEPAAAVCVSIFCAAAVERGWPDDESSLQRANDLEKRLDLMLGNLVDANNASNGTDSYGIEIVPAYSFPAADPRWDYPTYF